MVYRYWKLDLWWGPQGARYQTGGEVGHRPGDDWLAVLEAFIVARKVDRTQLTDISISLRECWR